MVARIRARAWWVVVLLAAGVRRVHAGPDMLALLANNLARGIAHKWLVERCPIQEGLFMDLYPIVVAEKGKGAYEVRDYAIGIDKLPIAPKRHSPQKEALVKFKDGRGHSRDTEPEYFDDRKQWQRNNAKAALQLDAQRAAEVRRMDVRTALKGRRRLLAVDPYAPGAGEGVQVTTAELERIAQERWQARQRHQSEMEANVTIIESWAEENDYREYFMAVKIIEDICVNNTLYDRGPAILRNELPEVLFDFMLFLHSSLGGCEPGECSTVMSPPPPSPPPEVPLPPHALGLTRRHPPLPPLPPAPCPEYAPPPCAVDMGAVSTSLLFGLATGAAGMWYVLKAK